MNRKRKSVIIALLSVFAATTVFAACGTTKNVIEVPTDKKYAFSNPDRVYAQPDEGFAIDGRADEEAYKNSKWVQLNNKNGTNTVDLSMTSHFGEKGMYFVYDVTESTPIYVNHDRASYINSGIEMYFAPNGVTSMSNDHVYEIDIEADGAVSFKKSSGYGGSWTNVETTDDIMAYAASQPKGGEINSGECFGYTLEFFIPWDYIDWLGMDSESIKEEAVSVNPVHITSYNYSGDQYEIDRYWYSFATQLGGDGWGNVGQYFKMNKNGVVGTASVTKTQGEHCTLTGPDAYIPGLPVTVTVTPEQGYAVSSLQCNGGECVKLLNYNADGSATYTVAGAEGGMTFSASVEAVTEGNKNLTGKINLKKAGGDTLDGLSASYFDADGEHTLTLDANGAFALNDLPQGYYEISTEKSGYGKVTRGIYLNRNIEVQIDLEYGMFDMQEGTCWDIAYANEGYLIKKSGRGAILSKNSYDTFYVEANFRYDAALAAQSSADEYYQQRTGFRIKFSEGKYWHPDVMCEGGEYKVTYGKIRNNESIFNWNTVHVMTAKEIAKYKSAEGIKLGILRVGTTAYLYLDGELIATTDLGAEGIKATETAQIGFEGYVYNSENWRIDYAIKEENADRVTLSKNETGGTVEMEEAYKVGDNVLLVLNKTNASDELLSLLVNGVEMSGLVENDGDADILTITGNTSLNLDVAVVYGAPQAVTANITVDSAWKANGIEFTFVNAADSGIVKTATVANNKMTIADMQTGRWIVKANVFGKNIELGSYSVVSEAEKRLDVENVFIDGKKLDPSVIDLSTGSFIYHSTINEDYSIKVNEQGDAFLAAKIKLGAADKATFMRRGEVSFGMYVTVKDENDKETTHWVDFWIKNADGQDFISLRTDFGWGEDFCKPLTTNVDSNKYAQTLFGDGLYVALRYKAETGVMETYFGDKDYNVAYLRDWNDSAHLFPVNGTVTQVGFRDNLSWGGTPVTLEVKDFRYGKTLLEALGVAGKDVTLHTIVDENKGDVVLDGAFKAGDDIKLAITPVNGQMLSGLTVNGVDMLSSVATDGKLIIKGYTGTDISVEATFTDAQYKENLSVSVSGKKYGVSGNAAEGKTVTLTRVGFTYTGTVQDGVVTFAEPVAIGDRYTLSIAGFIPQTGISVTAEGIADTVALEFDAFTELTKWGESDLSQQNSENAILRAKHGDSLFMGNETYDDVVVSVMIKGEGVTQHVQQGLLLSFVGDGLNAKGESIMVRMQNDVKVQFCPGKGEWWSYTEEAAGGAWNNLVYFKDCFDDNADRTADAHAEEYNAAYAAGTLKLTVLRRGSTIYAYLNDRFIGSQTLNAKYENAKCKVGFVQAGTNADWKSWTLDIDDEIAPVNISNTTATDAHGSVTLSATQVQIGDEVTVTLNPAADYKFDKVLVNGVDVAANVRNDAYTFVATGATEVKATFVPIEKVSFALSVVGKKYGTTENTLKGAEVTLSDGSHEYTVTVGSDGKAQFTDVISGGNYTLSAAGYLTQRNLTVLPVSGIADTVTLECDAFRRIHGNASNFDFSKQNESSPKITMSGDYGFVMTNDRYDEVMASVMLKGSGVTSHYEIGLLVNFVGDGLNEKGEAAMVRIEQKTKIQFAAANQWWGDECGIPLADGQGSGWNNLIFFSGDDDDYLEAFESGTLKLTVIRKGVNIYVYLNDHYIGKQTVAAKYADAKCEIGLVQGGTNNGAKTWTLDITETLPSVTVADGTTDTNGTIAITPNVKIGDTVTITVTPKENYALNELSVPGVNLTKAAENVYTFVATDRSYNATATFLFDGTIDSVDFNFDAGWGANGLAYTLSREGYTSYTGTIAGNKFTATDVKVGDWTFNANIYGIPVAIPVRVTSENVTVDLGILFANAEQAKGNVNVAENSLTYHGNVKEDLGINANLTNHTGDAWIVGKIQLSQAESAKILGAGNGAAGSQASIATYVTFSDGTYRYIDLNLSNKSGDMHLCLNDGSWWEDGHNWGSGCNVKLGEIKSDNTYTLSNYGKALFGGSGLYYIVNYNSTTGYLTVYYATGAGDFVLAKEMGHDPAVNKTVARFGINCGNGWGEADATFNISGFRYGTTLEEAWGIAPSALSIATPTAEHGSVVIADSNNAKVGDRLQITVTPDEGYVCASLKINGRQWLDSVKDGQLSYLAGADITSIVAIFNRVGAIITDNNSNIDLDAKIGEMNSIAYQAFLNGDTTFTNDALGLLNISAATSHKSGSANDFNQHGWAVTANGLTNGNAPCITGEFDMTVKLVKGVQQIRLFVGGWWMGNHGGVFTLQSKDGVTVYERVTYFTSSGKDPNDIIVINVDTSAYAADEVRELVLHFNGNGFDQLPFAGVQLLGDVSGFTKESTCTSTVTIYQADGETLADLGETVNLTLTDKDDATKTYTVALTKKDDGKYALAGNFRFGRYNLTLGTEGYECVSAGYDGIGTGDGAATIQLWIDSAGGGLWSITFKAVEEA